MRFDVRHVTEYQYDAPIRESVMEVWMQPRADQRQQLIDYDLEIEPFAQVFSYPDPWGNVVRHFDVPHPHDRLVITARSTVDTSVPPEPPLALDTAEWERARSSESVLEMWDFLHPHGFARPSERLVAFCVEHGLEALTEHDPLTAVRRLNEIIYRGLDYESGVTAADSPIDEALNAGRGVCQDFAHIMLAILRGWGLPARYVSGYLAPLAERALRSRPDASHAWVDAWFPSIGWVGFDPTNNVLASERHIVVALGRDYGDVPPSRGVYKGDAEGRLSVGVRITPAEGGPRDQSYLPLSASALLARRRRAAESGLMDQHQQQQQ